MFVVVYDIITTLLSIHLCKKEKFSFKWSDNFKVWHSLVYIYYTCIGKVIIVYKDDLYFKNQLLQSNSTQIYQILCMVLSKWFLLAHNLFLENYFVDVLKKLRVTGLMSCNTCLMIQVSLYRWRCLMHHFKFINSVLYPHINSFHLFKNQIYTIIIMLVNNTQKKW